MGGKWRKTPHWAAGGCVHYDNDNDNKNNVSSSGEGSSSINLPMEEADPLFEDEVPSTFAGVYAARDGGVGGLMEEQPDQTTLYDMDEFLPSFVDQSDNLTASQLVLTSIDEELPFASGNSPTHPEAEVPLPEEEEDAFAHIRSPTKKPPPPPPASEGMASEGPYGPTPLSPAREVSVPVVFV
jgi:hypothetical protein